MPSFSFLIAASSGVLISAFFCGTASSDFSDTVSSAARQNRARPAKGDDGARAGPPSMGDVAKPEMQ